MTAAALPETVPSAPRQVTAQAAVILAPNPSAMTLEGTNTWLLREPSAEAAVVVDPGPLDEGHLAAVAAAGPIAMILLTHGHSDHTEGAARLHELTRAPVRSLDPQFRQGLEGLDEGDVVALAGIEIAVLATPGHSADSLSFVLRAAHGDQRDAVLTGDTILGRGTTVVAHPDGRLDDYLASLVRLKALGETTVLPGHGPELPSAGVVAEAYLAHRQERLEQVRAALAAGDTTAEEVVARVYADVDRELWWAAEKSVRAQLDYLKDHPEG